MLPESPTPNPSPHPASPWDRLWRLLDAGHSLDPLSQARLRSLGGVEACASPFVPPGASPDPRPGGGLAVAAARPIARDRSGPGRPTGK